MSFETDSPGLWEDEDRFGAAAQQMIEQQIRRRGLDDARILAVMRRVPRHLFLHFTQWSRAYSDAALATLNEQTISQPYMVALMTYELNPRPDHTVLEVGTGSGYQTIILSQLCRRAISIERDADLVGAAQRMIDRFGIKNVTIHSGDGTLGWPEQAPYDRILVTAGAPDAPPALLDQLADPGCLVIPIGDREHQTLVTIMKRDGRISRTEGVGCRFVPLTGAQGWRA